MRIEIETLADLPLFNADEELAGPPASVVRLRGSVESAEGLLLVTPGYNRGVPGVMKNAVDWLSQPPRGSVIDGKPDSARLTDPATFGFVSEFLTRFATWVERQARL